MKSLHSLQMHTHLMSFFALLLSLATIFCIQTNLNAQCTLPVVNKVPIGAMLQVANDASRDRPFNDVFRLARGFQRDPQNFYSAAATTDNEGWATQDFSTVVMTQMTPEMGGTYRMRFLGRADIAPLSSGCTIRNYQFDSLTNISTADIAYPATVPSGETMILSFSNTRYNAATAGVKNIRIMRPGMTFDAPTFNTVFLQHLNRFSVLNFANWRNSTANTDSLWNERTLPTQATQSRTGGVSWETCIELANTLNKDIWVNIPHKANDLYIANLSNLLKSQLNSTVKIYLEYGFDIGNFGYETARWNSQQAAYEGALPNCAFNPEGSNDLFLLNSRRYAYRAKQMSDLFRVSFGNDLFQVRVRPILGCWTDWLAWSQRGLNFLDKTYGSLSRYFYALGISPQLKTSDVTTTATSSQILAELNAKLDSTFGAQNSRLDEWVARAAYHRLRLVATNAAVNTEGARNVAAKAEAHRSTAMQAVMQTFFQKWFAYGNEGLLLWNAAGAGNWEDAAGAFSLTEKFENSAKLQAIDAALVATVPDLTVGQSVLTPLELRKMTGYGIGWDSLTYLKPQGSQGFVEYLLRIKNGEAGDQRLVFQARTANNNDFFYVFFDGDSIGRVNVPNTGSFTSTFANTNSFTLNNPSVGLHTLRLIWGSTNFHLNNATLTKTRTCLGVATDEINAIPTVLFFPNPTQDVIFWEDKNGNIPADAAFIVSDIAGKIVYQQTKDIQSGISVAGLVNGIYFCQLKKNNQTIGIGKFVVAH